MSDDPSFLSEYGIAILRTGLAIRLRTMRSPGNPGPQLECLVRAERATELAHGILEAVEDWKSKHQH